MAKIKLRLSAKKENSPEPTDNNHDHDHDHNQDVSTGLPSIVIKSEEVASPKMLKIIPPRPTSGSKSSKKPSKTTSSSTKTTGSLPKIKLKTSLSGANTPAVGSPLASIDNKGTSISNTSTKNTQKTITSDLIPTIKFKPLDPSQQPPKKPKRTPTIKVKPAKLPGNGYDSEDPDKEDDPLIEEAIVLRFAPDENLDIVRAAVESAERGDKYNDNNGVDLSNISIIWKDKRRAAVCVGNAIYAAKLVNLPTISEVHKTIDRKNIYKTVDVSQMLLVVKRIEHEDDALTLKIDKEYGETYPDGLTPPMEFVKEVFHKKYENMVIQNVEDEVARLLKLDAEAESSVFEFIDADEEDIAPMSVIEGKRREKRARKEKKRLQKERKRLLQQKAAEANKSDGTTATTAPVANESMDIDDQFEDLDKEFDKLMEEGHDDKDLFGEYGDEEDNKDDDEEDDDEDEEEDEEEEEDDEDVEIAKPTNSNRQSEDEEDDDDDEDDDDEDEVVNAASDSIRVGGVDIDEPSQHNALIYDEISELQSTIEQKQKDLKKAVNPIMKNRIVDVINRLQSELDMKQSLIIMDKNKSKDNENGDESNDDAGDAEGEDDDEVDGQDVDHVEDGAEDEDNEEDEKQTEAGETAEKEAMIQQDAVANGNEEDEEEDEDDYDDLF